MHLLISAEEPAGALAADNAAGWSSYHILDVRYRLLGPSARPDYDEGHLPGARFVDLDRARAWRARFEAAGGDRGRARLRGEG